MVRDSTFAAAVLRRALTAFGALPLGALQHLGAAAGLLAWICSTRGASVCRENIEHCFPNLTRRRQRTLARRALMHAGRTLAESAIAWTREPAECLKLVDHVDGEATVDAIDGPIVFIIPHLGNWELLNHYLGGRYRLTHMYQPFDSAAAEAVIQKARSRAGTCFVRAGNVGIRAQRKQLARGGAIGSMPDQEPPVHAGEFAPFFGQTALTSTLVPALCRKTGATPVLATCLRNGSRFHISMSVIEGLHDAPSMNAAIEGCVRLRPEQYLWTYKRFRTRPEGEAERYRFRQTFLRVVPVKLIRALSAYALQFAGLARARSAGAALGDVLFILRSRRRRDAETNLDITSQPADIARSSLRESAKTIAETPVIWSKGVRVSADDPPDVRGAIVLTPPLGNREVVLRFLADRGRIVDYYHPLDSTAADDRVRARRSAAGIALAPETDEGLRMLVASIGNGDTVTLCPDQQPRLRGGYFIPFFGVPALTTKVLPELIEETGAPVFCAVAWRTARGFDLQFHEIERASLCHEALLAQVNSTLETLIMKDPSQYRWSDRRFNIRPSGERKLY